MKRLEQISELLYSLVESEYSRLDVYSRVSEIYVENLCTIRIDYEPSNGCEESKLWFRTLNYDRYIHWFEIPSDSCDGDIVFKFKEMFNELCNYKIQQAERDLLRLKGRTLT